MLWDPGESESWKNLKSKISRQTPFNSFLFQEDNVSSVKYISKTAAHLVSTYYRRGAMEEGGGV
jgi:hypothetical protein